MKFRDVEHLFRLAAIFAFGALLFVIVQAEMRPADFGRDGHYRPASVDEIRARPIAYAGQQACVECHADVAETRAQARHKGVACESCHGPLAAHAQGTDDAKPKRPEGATLCARCHAAKTGKPKRYPIVDIKEHAGDENCLTCHKPHDPRIG
jgi:uncharacterized CHY-type Zn-finger protein